MISCQDILEARQAYQEVFFSEVVLKYMLEIINQTRQSDQIILGVSPRGSLGLYKCCKAYAAIKGRNYVLPDDVKFLAKHVLAHRIIIKGQGFTSENNPEKEILKIIQAVKAPTESFHKEQ